MDKTSCNISSTRELEISIFKAEANGWRVGISKISKKKPNFKPLLHTEWFSSHEQALKKYKQMKRRC